MLGMIQYKHHKYKHILATDYLFSYALKIGAITKIF